MRRVEEPVPYEEAKRRVLEYLSKNGTPRLARANSIAEAIWPGARMTSQGAGGAAARILKRMAAEGLVRWDSQQLPSVSWGWRQL